MNMDHPATYSDPNLLVKRDLSLLVDSSVDLVGNLRSERREMPCHGTKHQCRKPYMPPGSCRIRVRSAHARSNLVAFRGVPKGL